MVTELPASARLDYWLWCVRVFKTRAVAKEACLAGHVAIDSRRAKPASTVSVGQRVTVRTPVGVRVLEVLALPPTRVSAADVTAFLVDHTPPTPPRQSPQYTPGVTRERGLGRPTKKDRRAIESWRAGRR